MLDQSRHKSVARTSANKRTRTEDTTQKVCKMPKKSTESPGAGTLSVEAQEPADTDHGNMQQPSDATAGTAHASNKQEAVPETIAAAKIHDNPSTSQQQQAQQPGQPALRRSARLRINNQTANTEATTTITTIAPTATGKGQQQPQQQEESQTEQLITNPTRSKALRQTKSSKARASNSKGSKSASTAANGPTRAAEQRLWQQGFKYVAGVDEAGRGPLAGPVVAAAVMLPPDANFPGLNDSKQMTEEDRERLYEQLTTHDEVIYAVSVVDHEMIDEINILQAAMLAMQQAVEQLSTQPDHLLIDGNRRPKGLRADLPAQLLVKGDATSTCIAAASVIAKVTRDRLMLQLDKQYPQYGFAQHKGYGVPAHRAAIQQYGPCPIHRRSFEPIKSMTGWAGYGQKAAAAAAAAATTELVETVEAQPAETAAGVELVVAAATTQVVSGDGVDAAAVGGGVLSEVQVAAGSITTAAAAVASGGRKLGRGRRKQEQQTPEPVAA